MGEIVPFIDLNLSPSPVAPNGGTSTASGGATTATPSFMKVPKVEPKLEPLDESPLEIQQLLQDQPDSYLQDPIPMNFYTDSQSIPQSQSALVSVADDNVYSEYYRISELFRTAFAKRLEQEQQQQQQQYYGDASASDPDAQAIVPINTDHQVSATSAPKVQRKYPKRSSELVRVTDLQIEDKRYFRDLVRSTRLVFDSFRIYAVAEEEKRLNAVGPVFRKPRGDLLAASVMRDRGLWINRDKRIVGSIPGIEIGDVFFFRMELCVLGLHGQPQAGIDYLPGSQSSNGQPIATGIIVSGGYEDDEDAGDAITYTGHGGQDKFGKHCINQKLEGGNLAMERSMHYGIEVRVVRGFKYEGSISSKIYVYDGLYRIHDYWFDVGKSGFGVYKFKLSRIEGQEEMGSAILKFAGSLRTKPLSVRPTGYIHLDISNRKENVPVMVFNDMDNFGDPLYHDYLVKTVFPPHLCNTGSSGTGCECVSGCVDGCFCAMKNGGEFAYDQHGFLVRGKPLIFECGPFCKCPPSCRNRVSQRGLRKRMEVFRSMQTGWGVRSLDLIHAGSFVCEYAGVALTREQAEIFAMSGDTLIYPSRFTSRWAEWGDLSRIYPDYVRPTYPALPPLDFAMDVSRMRNVACYMSHSTAPNVMVQFVLHDHNNLMFPHLMIFATENIPPLRELSLDYGVTDDATGKLAICN
ncbi:Histone-lysine N-methyltransferase family member SUVH9 [Linum perenne]